MVQKKISQKETTRSKTLPLKTTSKEETENRTLLKRVELTTLRTKNTKTFENLDHSITTELYFSPVHYQDMDGEWKDMDDTLIDVSEAGVSDTTEAEQAAKTGLSENVLATPLPESGNGFRNRKGRWQVRFGVRANEEAAVLLARGNDTVSWHLEGAAAAKSCLSDGKQLLYPEILPGVDARYRIFGESVKENLILKSRDTAPQKLSFCYHTKNLEAVQIGSRIEFRNASGQEVFRFSAPLMHDAAGKNSETLQIALEKISQLDKTDESSITEETSFSTGNPAGNYRITLTPDRSWLLAEERVYPVVVDPVTTTSRSLDDIEDAHVDSLNFGTNYETGIFLKTMGGDNIQRSFLKFVLPSLKTGDMIVNARLVLVSLAQDSASRSIEVHRVLQDWSASTLDWNNRPTCSETVEDIVTYTGDAQKYVTLDITNLVKNWYINGGNYGLMIKDPYELSGYTEFLSSDCHEGYQDMRPHIDISYRNCSGLEEFWSYHTQEAGRAGTVHVNDYNGNLILVHDVLSMSGSLMPAQISAVYNTNHRSSDVGYGYGVRLNYHQRVVQKTIGGTDYYKHYDGDGAENYFYYDSENQQWKDENGKGLVLTVNDSTSASPFVITDKKNNQSVFNKNGYLIRQEDNNGNTLTITRSGTRVKKLTDGAGRETLLSYDTDASGNLNHLIRVTDPSGRVKTFAYTSGMLTSITDVDGACFTYAYDANRMLTSVKNADGYELRYTYGTESPYRVSGITEYADGVSGAGLILSYGYNSTRYTDQKGRTEIYRFNNSGNLIHIHDGFGHAASGTYNRSGNHVNCLENETRLQSNIVQLLKDPIIQASSCGWKHTSNDSSVVTCSINTDTACVKIGTRSLKIVSTDVAHYGCWYQDVTVEKGKTYTFSMYVQAELSALGTNGRCFVQLRGKDKDGNDLKIKSELLKMSTSGFVQLSATITLPSDASSDTVRAYLYLYRAKGTLYGDLAQLEPGETPNRCNLVENGDFHLGTTTGFNGSGTTPEDQLTCIGNSVYRPVQAGAVITADSAPLYQSPSTSATQLTTLTKGTHFAVLNQYKDSSGGLWYRSRTVGGQIGYIRLGACNAFVAGGDGFLEGIVATGGSVLRSTPSDDGTVVLYTLNRGTRLAIRNKQFTDDNGKSWLYVALSYGTSERYFGYIPERSVMHMARNHAYGTLTADQEIYLGPSTGASVQGTLKQGAEVVLKGVIKKDSGVLWYGVLNGSTMCYFPPDNLSVTVPVLYDSVFQEQVSEQIGGLDAYIYKFQGDPEKAKKLTKTLDLCGKKAIRSWSTPGAAVMPFRKQTMIPDVSA